MRNFKEADRKVNALTRISPYIDLEKRCILMNSFFTSQFNYCPFVWMFHSRTMNNKINHLHERFLRIVYSVLFERLIERDKFVQIHIRNLQILAIEIFKVSKDSFKTKCSVELVSHF